MTIKQMRNELKITTMKADILRKKISIEKWKVQQLKNVYSERNKLKDFICQANIIISRLENKIIFLKGNR